MKALFPTAFLSAALAGLAGAAAATDIDFTDRGRFIGGLRGSIDIAPKGERPAVPHGGHGIEFGVSGADGGGTQSLSIGQGPVIFAGQVFAAPGQLLYEAEFGLFEVAYRYRKFFGGGEFGIEALGGVGFAELDLSVTSGAQRASEKLTNGGLLGGFGIVWHMRPDTSLQSRLTIFGSGAAEDVSSAARFDVYVAHAFTPNIALRVGLASWNARSARDDSVYVDSFNSPIRAHFSGLAAGLDFAF